MATSSQPRSHHLSTFLLLLTLLLTQTHAQSVLQTCFPDYSTCAQEIILPLFEATGCTCPGPGSCLCSNNNYLFAVMAGVGSCCTSAEIANTAQTIIDNCSGDFTPAGVTAAELQDAGNAAVASVCAVSGLKGTTKQASSTPTTPATGGSPTTVGTTPVTTGSSSGGGGGSSSGGGYSTSDKIALGVGIGVGLPATIAGILTLWMMCIRG